MDFDCNDYNHNDILKKLIDLLSKVDIIKNFINIVKSSQFYKFVSGNYSLTITYIIFIIIVASFQLLSKYSKKSKIPKTIVLGFHGLFITLISLEIVNDFSKYGFAGSFQNMNSSETFGNFFMLFHSIKNIIDYLKERQECTCFGDENDENDEEKGIKLLSNNEIKYEIDYMNSSRNQDDYIPLR